MTQALIPLADGVEEMEAVILSDVLRRADWTVLTAGIAGEVVTAARGVRRPGALTRSVAVKAGGARRTWPAKL